MTWSLRPPDWPKRLTRIANARRGTGYVGEVLDLLTQFIRNAPVIAFVKDLEGRYRHVSEPWLFACRTTEDQVVGKSDYDLFDQAQADVFVKNDREVLESGRPSRRFEEVLVPPEVRTFLSTKFPLV